VSEPRGSSGFGYDPVFIADSTLDGRTFAELTPDEKNLISHRACALSKLHAALSQRADL
jgi:XTP/dITP diphosphohydrolase